MTTGAEELLARVRSRRKLPPAEDRRRIREKAGVSVRDMAEALGVSHMTVVNWEAGSTPKDERRDAYAQLLADLERATS
jgi:DNA-binding transcriptional regulator YiaG